MVHRQVKKACKHKNSTNLSGFWKGLIIVKEVLSLALAYAVRSGHKISFWKDQRKGGGRYMYNT